MNWSLNLNEIKMKFDGSPTDSEMNLNNSMNNINA